METREKPILLTIDDVINLTSLSRSYINEQVRNGEIKVYKFGRAVRFKREEIEEFIEKRLKGEG